MYRRTGNKTFKDRTASDPRIKYYKTKNVNALKYSYYCCRYTVGTANGEIKPGQFRGSHNRRKNTNPVKSSTSTKEEKYPWNINIFNYDRFKK